MVHKDERPDRKDRSVHPEDMQMLADTQMAGSGTSVKELDSSFTTMRAAFRPAVAKPEELILFEKARAKRQSIAPAIVTLRPLLKGPTL